MNDVKIIEIKKSVYEANENDANKLRNMLKEHHTLLLNIMSSPGSGKTSTLIRTINMLKDRYKIAVMEADIDSDVDARKIFDETGVDAIQIHTGGMCHLDAFMTKQGLDQLDIDKYDLIFLENVGNLVCPAEFDTGSVKDVMILSVPEGDDKPLKYPLMFSICDLVLINKMDTLDVFDFDLDRCIDNIKLRNKDCEIYPISAKNEENIYMFAEWIEKEIEEWGR